MEEFRQNLCNLGAAWGNCQGCKELTKSRKNVVFGYGNHNAQLMVIGEAPGPEEDEMGIPFVGPSGDLLEYLLAISSANEGISSMCSDFGGEEFSTSREESLKNTFFTTAVCCLPPDGRPPTTPELSACRPRLLETIYCVDPVLIIALGGSVATTLMGKKVTTASTQGKIIDCIIPGRLVDVTYPILVVFPPSYHLRNADFDIKGGMFDKTIDNFVLAGRILDEFNYRHFGIKKPSNRPQFKKG